jgi:hypothetical protein
MRKWITEGRLSTVGGANTGERHAGSIGNSLPRQHLQYQSRYQE